MEHDQPTFARVLLEAGFHMAMIHMQQVEQEAQRLREKPKQPSIRLVEQDQGT